MYKPFGCDICHFIAIQLNQMIRPCGQLFTAKVICQFFFFKKAFLETINFPFSIPKIQFAKHIKLKKKEVQSVDTLFLLRMGNKISMDQVIKFWAEMEGRTMQSLPYLGIHPINKHQTQTLLHMPARFCWQGPDISDSCEALPGPGKCRSGCS